jgi:hypothetical protein
MRIGTSVRRGGVVAAATGGAMALMMSAAFAGFGGDNNRDGQIDQGDTGGAVVCAQQAVIYTGGSVGSSGADGQFGPATKAGVVRYQEQPHAIVLLHDGKVGFNTGGVMASDIRALRVSFHQHGDTTNEAKMVSWLNRCAVSSITDSSGRQIFH